jgi:hypothetical protein
MFLLNPNKHKSSAHLWTGSNTVCKLYGTGGMNKSRQMLSTTTRGKPICTMCLSVSGKINTPVWRIDKEYEDEVNNFTVKFPML